MDQLSSQNINSKCKSPKFLRRSVSPVDYMSSSEFRAREKRRDIHIDFGYVTEKKLGKISIKKRESICGRSESKQTNDQRHSQKSQPSTNLENSFVKTNHDMSTSNFQRSVGQYGSDPTIDSDILKSLEEDSEVLKAQINLHEQLCNARKKIFELQSEVESKNRIIQEQSKEIKGLQSKMQQASCKAQKFRVEAETTNIKLRMEMRKSCDFLTQIKKLKVDNIRKRNILQRVHIRQQSSQYNRYSEYAVDVFELSPQKSQD